MSQSDSSSRLSAIPNPKGSKLYSYAYLSVLFLLTFGSVAAAIHLGYLNPNITIHAAVNIGQFIEWLVAGVVILFLLFTAGQVANILGMSFIAGVVRAADRMLHGYQSERLLQARNQLPDDEEGE